MVLNEEKRVKLVEVLALREEAIADVGASTLLVQPTNQAVPSPTPSAPLAVVPLATVRASPMSCPLEKGKGVVEIVSDDEEDTTEGPIFKRRKAATATTSHSSSARRPASFRDHPPSASSPQVLKRINNAYQIDLPEEYGVHTTFNVMDLTPFASSEDEKAEACDLRTNPLKEGGDDGRGPSSDPSSGPTTRSMARGFKKIRTLLLMAEKLFFICSKRTIRSKAQAMGASFFICNFIRI